MEQPEILGFWMSESRVLSLSPGLCSCCFPVCKPFIPRSHRLQSYPTCPSRNSHPRIHGLRWAFTSRHTVASYEALTSFCNPLGAESLPISCICLEGRTYISPWVLSAIHRARPHGCLLAWREFELEGWAVSEQWRKHITMMMTWARSHKMDFSTSQLGYQQALDWCQVIRLV